MIEIIWQYEIRDEARGHFELAYGPGGALSKLYAGAPGFRGLTLLRDIKEMGRYLSIEIWDTTAEREEALVERREAFDKLQADFSEWSRSGREVGSFRILAEASVRPKRKTRRGRAGRR
ncbi:MAG: antibiotic biosynthesis monooxygenase [Candidatus Promineifilaceae bacterium]|nr:antibiotic biosynthesis monooxygenase [Candidatus Promineifilaceae bacterium]